MAQKPIQAAGGIVVRNGARALVAVVQRAKDDHWVLPRGKLERGENASAGARREVVEETGIALSCKNFSAPSPIARAADPSSFNSGA